MRVLIYGDFRSPHAQGWLAGLRRSGIRALGLSSEQVSDLEGIEGPNDWIATARQSLVKVRSAGGAGSFSRSIASKSPPETVQTAIAMARLPQRRRQIASTCSRFKPDIVHALRFPYEGVTALSSSLSVPVVVSTWGADFHPQAESSRALTLWIRSRMAGVAGLHYDAKEDHDRALSYGLSKATPSLHAAGNFGVDAGLFYPSKERDARHVVYPRGINFMSNPRGFIEAAALAADVPGVRFTAVGLKGVDFAEKARETPALKDKLVLTPKLNREDFASLIRSAGVIVSPGFSDGMPNSILEALACGSAAVVGRLPQFEALANDIPNLYLADAQTPSDVAAHIRRALSRSATLGVQIPPPYRAEVNIHRVPMFYEAVLRNVAGT